MKKLSILGIGLCMAFGFAACDNYEEPNPPAQSNPQESILKTDDVELVSLLQELPYDLAGLNDADQVIEAASINCETLPESFTFGTIAYISNNDFATSTEVPTTVVPSDSEGMWTVTINPDDLQAAYFSGISKGPSTKTIQIRYQITTIQDSQVAYVGGGNYYYGPYSMQVTPFPSDFVIEEAYYLIGTADNWSVADSGAFKFSHSDKNQYDDPVFTLIFDVTQEQADAGWWWKIIPQSTYEAGDWVSDADNSQFGVEVNGADAMSGMLVPYTVGNEPGAGQFNHAGRWMLTINMEDMTFEFTNAIEFLYTPGNSNGWSQEASQLLSTTDYMNYFGYAHLNGEFKFSTQPNWDGVNYGAGGSAGELSTDGGAGNLNAATDGLYWCHVDITALSYDITLIDTIGLIGDATEGGWDSSTPLTPSEDFLTWTGTVKLGSGEFKFRANNGWDINLGGDLNNLVQDGGNMAVPNGEGTYEITLNLGQLPYSANVVKK